MNLRSAALGTKYAAQAMKASQSKGCIINTASIAGFAVQLAATGPPVYVPSGECVRSRLQESLGGVQKVLG